MDNAANFVRGSIAAVGDITSTTLTYTLAGPTAFPTPDAGNYNPDVGYNCTVWMSGTYNSPDLDPNAAIFRVTSETSTVLTGYFTEGTAQPTAAGTYSVAMGSTEKTRDDVNVPFYYEPFELFVTNFCDFEIATSNAQNQKTIAGIYQVGSGAASSSTTLSEWTCATTATSGTTLMLGRANGVNWDSGQVLSSLGTRFSHRAKFFINPSSGANTDAAGWYGWGSVLVQMTYSGGYLPTGTASGVGFRVNNAVSTTVLQCVNKIGATETVFNYTPVGGLNQKMILEVIANSTQSQFYANGVLLTTLSTNLPTASLGLYLGIANTAAVVESFTIDWLKTVRPR